MSAVARALSPAQSDIALPEPTVPSLDGVTLSALFKAVSERRPEAILLKPPGEGAEMSWAAFVLATRWIARMLVTMGREQPATVLLPMALDSRAMVAVAACLQAGMNPMIVRPDLDAETLTAKAETIGATIAIGASPDGVVPTLETMREMAARSFGMRCVAGFGSVVPDGIVPLDRLMQDLTSLGDTAPARSGSLFLDGEPPVAISETDLLTASFDIARAIRVSPDARVVTAMTGGSLAALASSLGLAIISGAELVPLGLFTLTGLWSSFAGGQSVHLVVPAEIEPALTGSGMLSHRGLASIVLIHRKAPTPLPVPAGARCRIFDIGPVMASRLTIRQRS